MLVFQEYGYWAENSGEQQRPSGTSISEVHNEVSFGSETATVSAGGKVSLLDDVDKNRKHAGRSMLFSPLPFLQSLLSDPIDRLQQGAR